MTRVKRCRKETTKMIKWNADAAKQQSQEESHQSLLRETKGWWFCCIFHFSCLLEWLWDLGKRDKLVISMTFRTTKKRWQSWFLRTSSWQQSRLRHLLTTLVRLLLREESQRTRFADFESPLGSLPKNVFSGIQDIIVLSHFCSRKHVKHEMCPLSSEGVIDSLFVCSRSLQHDFLKTCLAKEHSVVSWHLIWEE